VTARVVAAAGSLAELEQLSRVVCTCACGKTFTEFEARKRFKAVQRLDDGVKPDRMAYFDCDCRSTHGLWLDDDGNVVEETP
jgi:hypothetical protein